MVSVIRGNDNFDSGDTGGSTDYGSVGSYGHFSSIVNPSTNFTTPGSTAAGSNLASAGGNAYPYNTATSITGTSYAVAGTWRLMGSINGNGNIYAGSVFARVS